MLRIELRRALAVWRAVYLIARAHGLLDEDRLAEVRELGERLRRCLKIVEREGSEGSAASVARATLNRMTVLLGELRATLSRGWRL
jgi:hypothetical protein